MMNIIFASDDNFAMQAGIAITSLFENNKNNEIVVYYLIDNFSEINKQKISSIVKKYKQKLFFIDVGSYLAPLMKKFPALNKSYLAYARLFIDCFIPSEIERILYLDCDTLIRGDITELYTHNFCNNSLIACCIDTVSEIHKRNLKLKKDSFYYNSGVILFNLKQIRETGYFEKLRNFILYAQSNKIPLLYHDQDIINIVFSDKISTLPLKYNVMSLIFYFRRVINLSIATGVASSTYYNQNELCSAIKNPVICHFTRDPFFVRPWYKNSNHIYYPEYVFYKNLTPWASVEGFENPDDGWNHRLLISLSRVLPARVFAFVCAIIYKIYFRLRYDI